MGAKRSLGVSEARLGLSLLTAVLLVFGYVALQRVGGNHDTPPVEIRDPSATTPLTGNANTQTTSPDGLRVLKVQNPQPNEVPRTSLAPTIALPDRIDLGHALDEDDGDLTWPAQPGGTDDPPSTNRPRYSPR